MTTANERFLDAQLQRAVELELLAGAVARDLNDLLDEDREWMELEIRRAAEAAATSGLRGASAGRVRSILARMRQRRAGTFAIAQEQAEALAARQVVAEVSFQAESAQEALQIAIDFNRPSPEALRALASRVPIDGKTTKEWFGSLARADMERIWGAVRTGIIRGDGARTVVQRVLGGEGTLSTTADQVDAVARTFLNGVGNLARDEMWAANADIIVALIWVATLDGRTCIRCAALDGMRFPLREGPRPPIHPRDRCVMVAAFDDGPILGTRPFVRTTGPAGRVDFRTLAREQAGDGWKSLDAGERKAATARARSAWGAEHVGQVPATTTWSEWFPNQPAAFQDRAIGPGRGKLLRAGGLTAKELVDPRTWRQYTLKELRVMHPRLA